jgi:hypothetical protein
MMPEAEAASTAVGGSFRDPSGHVFTRDGRVLRQVNLVYAPEYEQLRASGLYDVLVDEGLLVPHAELDEDPAAPDVYRIIAPERIPFVSYPFEWSFSQLKSAALTTLKVQRAALAHGMTLKDATAYNIQFRGAAPVLIDTLSFERWQEGTPWVAYRQFCQHFLGPLALMSTTDVRLGALSRLYIDGPPLDFVSRLLPFSSRLHPSLLLHLHIHAHAQSRHGGRARALSPTAHFGRRSMLGLIEHLESAVVRLRYKPAHSIWADYYNHTNYSAPAMADKERIVTRLLERARPSTVWDLGANTGAFSRLAASQGAYTVAFDGDSDAVEQHYTDCRARSEARVLPLVMDLSNPTGPIGWGHAERLSLTERGPADVVLALGLLHHLSLANQVPFQKVAAFFQGLGRSLVIEFVARTDSQVAGMLSRMPRLDDSYVLDAFEREFGRCFAFDEMIPVGDSDRRIYLMRRKEPT